MANIILYNNYSDYESYMESGEYVEPHISYCEDKGCIQYNTFIIADDEYNTELLQRLKNLDLCASSNYMTQVEAKNLGAVYFDNYSDTEHTHTEREEEFNKVYKEHPDYIWFISYASNYKFSQFFNGLSSFYSYTPKFGMDSSLFPPIG